MKPDKDVQEFIQEVVSSLVIWELIIFLWNNPGITDRAAGIATRLGRRREDVREPLEFLVKEEVLEKWGDDAEPVYAFKRNSKYEKAMEKFVKFSLDKEGKLWIWTQLLHKGLR